LYVLLLLHYCRRTSPPVFFVYWMVCCTGTFNSALVKRRSRQSCPRLFLDRSPLRTKVLSSRVCVSV
jgi:hypothetical protein